ncbi:MAG: hypothetical protein V1809_06140 [Planctomycetota bacterium]
MAVHDCRLLVPAAYDSPGVVAARHPRYNPGMRQTPAMDENAWLEREARKYRRLPMARRVAMFRDLERCQRALAPRPLPPDPDPLTAAMWSRPAGRRP